MFRRLADAEIRIFVGETHRDGPASVLAGKSVDMRELQYVVAHLSLVSHVNHPVVCFDFENAKIMINFALCKR